MPKDSRRYPQRPILGVGAIIFKGSRVLLVERGGAPLQGYWSLPGGVVEAGEQLQDALRREILEETGLTVKPLGVFEIFERIMRDAKRRPEYHYVLIDYVCRVVSGEPKAASDARTARWVSATELSDYRITEGTLPVIERAFRERARFRPR
jgi:mutator protein MutT